MAPGARLCKGDSNRVPNTLILRDRFVCDRRDRNIPGCTRITLSCLYFISPDAEAFKHVRAEGHADGDVCSITTSRDQHTTNARHVVVRVKHVPGSPNIRFKPTRKIHWLIDGRNTDITKIAGAIASRNIQTST